MVIITLIFSSLINFGSTSQNTACKKREREAESDYSAKIFQFLCNSVPRKQNLQLLINKLFYRKGKGRKEVARVYKHF